MLDTGLRKVGTPKITIEVRPVFEHPNGNIRDIVWTPFAGRTMKTEDTFIRKTYPPIAEIPDEALYKEHWFDPFKRAEQVVTDFMTHYTRALRKGNFAMHVA